MKILLATFVMLLCSSYGFAKTIDSEYFHIEVPSNMLSVGALMGLTPDLGYMFSNGSGDLTLAVLNVPNEKNLNINDIAQQLINKHSKSSGLKINVEKSNMETKCVLESDDYYSIIPPVKMYCVILMNKDKTHCATILLNFLPTNADDAMGIITNYLEKADLK